MERIPIFSITRIDLAFSGLALAMTRSKPSTSNPYSKNTRARLRRQALCPTHPLPGHSRSRSLLCIPRTCRRRKSTVADEGAGLFQHEGPHRPAVLLIVGRAVGDELPGLLLRPWLVVPDVLHHLRVEGHRSDEQPVVRLPVAYDQPFRFHQWVVVQNTTPGRQSNGIRAYRRLVPPPCPDSVIGAYRYNASLSFHCT